MSDFGVEGSGDSQEWLRHARHGDYERAWQASDRILERHFANPDFSRPRHEQSIWTGNPIDGARVLVRCYHGLGDTIQFSRYFAMLRARAREVIVWAQPSLLRILETVGGIDRLVPLTEGAPDVDYDVDVEVMELPFVFRSTLVSLPSEVPYVHVPAADVPGIPPRIGLAWRCGEWEMRRSVPFHDLQPILDVEGVTWCSLQQHSPPDEVDPRLTDISADDIYEAGTRMAALDLVITVDSMPAHLAGSLGIPVWTLLRQDADWRWMEGRDDSPWYPTMRLFRQRSEGAWPEVIKRVAEAVRSRGPLLRRPS